MLHPLEFAVPTVTFQIGKGPFEERAVLASSWQSPEGLVGHCFVNITDQKQSLDLSLDTRGAAGWAKADIDVCRAGSSERQSLRRNVVLPQAYRLTMEPLEAVFLVLRPD